MFLWYLLAGILGWIFICEIYAFITGVPTVTSSRPMRKKMAALIKEEAESRKSNQPLKIVDLGSGSGKLALEIARVLPKAKITGIEISFLPLLLSKVRRFLWRTKNVSFKCEDFWDYNISDIDVIVLYVNSKVREKMAAKLRAELKDGAYILSNETHLPGWKAEETYEVGLLKLKLVSYRKYEELDKKD